MTPAEQNRAVAEICKLPIEKRGNVEFVFYNDLWRPIGFIGGFDPLRDANQAIEALDRMGACDIEWARMADGQRLCSVLLYAKNGEFEAKGRNPDPVKAFCAAAVAAIMAAGGKK